MLRIAGGAGMQTGDRYSRKQKSLGLLCENFISLFGKVHGEVISLDEASQRLDVPRRRLYDVVNVLESVNIVARHLKNRWTPSQRPSLPFVCLLNCEWSFQVCLLLTPRAFGIVSSSRTPNVPHDGFPHLSTTVNPYVVT